MNNLNKLTRKDRHSMVWRWNFIGSNTLNYGTLQGTAYAWAMAKTLRKLYQDDQDYIKAMTIAFEYYNITPYMGPLVMGADLAIEEKEGVKALESVRSIKTSLMGPVSGIGDSLLWVLYPTIMGSIAGYLALEKNPLGAIIWILLNLCTVILRFKLYDIGYKSGARLMTDLSHKLGAITESASVMGLTVVGSLIASVVKVYTPVVFHFKEVKLELQSAIFDRILPGFLAVCLTVLVYYLMEKRKWGFLKVVLVILVFALIGSYFNFLGIA